MSSLSGKSDKEISQLLDEYGIKHGPIVESTRKLYEKKLNEAMTKKTKPSSPDKTYYREEQEEVEYVTYHQPQQPSRHDAYGEVTRRSKISEPDFSHEMRSNFTDYRDDGAAYTNEPVISQTRTAYQSSSRLSGPSVSTSLQRSTKPESSKSAGVPNWLRVLVFLIIIAFVYYVYTCMEPAKETPFKVIK